LGELLAVENATDIVRHFDQGGVKADALEPGDVLPDDSGIGTVVTAAYQLHIRGLQKRLGRSALKRHGIGTEPRFVFHDNDVAGIVDD
jgi:hypothetical protein